MSFSLLADSYLLSQHRNHSQRFIDDYNSIHVSRNQSAKSSTTATTTPHIVANESLQQRIPTRPVVQQQQNTKNRMKEYCPKIHQVKSNSSVVIHQTGEDEVLYQSSALKERLLKANQNLDSRDGKESIRVQESSPRQKAYNPSSGSDDDFDFQWVESDSKKSKPRNLHSANLTRTRTQIRRPKSSRGPGDLISGCGLDEKPAVVTQSSPGDSCLPLKVFLIKILILILQIESLLFFVIVLFLEYFPSA